MFSVTRAPGSHVPFAGGDETPAFLCLIKTRELNSEYTDVLLASWARNILLIEHALTLKQTSSLKQTGSTGRRAAEAPGLDPVSKVSHKFQYFIYSIHLPRGLDALLVFDSSHQKEKCQEKNLKLTKLLVISLSGLSSLGSLGSWTQLTSLALSNSFLLANQKEKYYVAWDLQSERPGFKSEYSLLGGWAS